MQVYAIYDSKLGQFLLPFFCESDKHAQKIISNSLGAQSQLVLYPSDYELWFLDSFDEEEGHFLASEKKFICSLSKLIPVKLRECALDGSFGDGSAVIM